MLHIHQYFIQLFNITSTTNNISNMNRNNPTEKEGFYSNRIAYNSNMNRNIHEQLIQKSHDELHITGGQFSKSLVYAGVDGTTNVLVVILSGISSLNPHQVLAMCIAVIVSDGLGMGFGDFLSAKAQADYILSQQQRQLYEVEHFLEAQKKEIVSIYTQKGYEVAQSQRLAHLFSSNKQVFVNIMMLEQLKLVKIDPNLAYKCGIVTLFSFLFFGVIPAIPYIITSGILQSKYHPWIQCACIGIVELFSLGFLKGYLIQINKWKAGAEIMMLGAVVTSIGYGIGLLFA